MELPLKTNTAKNYLSYIYCANEGDKICGNEFTLSFFCDKMFDIFYSVYLFCIKLRVIIKFKIIKYFFFKIGEESNCPTGQTQLIGKRW